MESGAVKIDAMWYNKYGGIQKKGTILIIYKITNLLNDKIYIGQTVNSLSQRWRGHCFKGEALYFAIKKYGSSNFSKKIICKAKNLEELNEKEKAYILKYDSIAPKGYNIQLGGKGRGIMNEISKKKLYRKIICLDNGDVYNSLKEASSILNLKIKNISSVLRGKQKSTGGFCFRYVDSKFIKNVIYEKENQKKVPIQCLSNGIIYKSIAEAARKLNIRSVSNIHKQLNGTTKSVEGFRFKRII